ncbi:hypothetical protein EYF80_031337 [Liparis tanakae]|uniref:Uncharacterized protein n=1 Tax=Liparis tanakae TaxID=230148 RepID=A0A4Z2GY47_9TELE|nr:hypothetical protein EYF80_031337 [Liparis tanakae]
MFLDRAAAPDQRVLLTKDLHKAFGPPAACVCLRWCHKTSQQTSLWETGATLQAPQSRSCTQGQCRTVQLHASTYCSLPQARFDVQDPSISITLKRDKSYAVPTVLS